MPDQKQGRRGCTPVTTPAAPAVPPQDTKPERFDLSFCILGVIMIVVGFCLTFHWMAAPGESRFLGCADTWQYYGPIEWYMDHCIHHGEFPLWNPLYFCGQPYAANPQSFLFYPPNLIRSLLTFNPTPLRTHIGIAVMVAAQLLLGGMSAFFLARRHALSYGAALLAAFAFVFSAPLVTRSTGHWVFTNSVCWLPLTLLLLNHALSQRPFRRRLGFAAAAALSWGLTILGGVPFLMVLTALTMAMYALLFRALHPFEGLDDLPAAPAAPVAPGGRKKSPQPPRDTSLRRFVRYCRRAGSRDAAVIAIVLLGGLVTASPLLLPGAEFSSHTDRMNKSDTAHEDFAPVSAGWDFLRMLIVYQGHGNYEGIRSSGAIVFMLTLAAFAFRPRRDVALFGLILLALLDCSLSQPLFFNRLLSAVAPFRMGNPGRAMIVACLPLGMLAGFGADAAIARLARMRARIVRSVIIASAGLLVVMVVALARRPEPVLPVGAAVILLPAAACIVALAAGWIPEPTIWGTALAMLVLGETLAWNRHLIPSVVPKELQFPGSLDRLSAQPEFWPGNRRNVDMQPNVKMYALESVMNGYDPMCLSEVRDVLCNTPTNKAFRRLVYAPELTAFSYRGNLFLKRAFWLARQYVDGPLPERNELFPSATTVFLDKPGPLPVPQVARESLPKKGHSDNFTSIPLHTRGQPPILVLPKDIDNDKNAIQFRGMKIPPRQSSLLLTVAGRGEVKLLPLFVEPGNEQFMLGRELTLRLQNDIEQPLEIPMPDIENVQILLRPEFKTPSDELRLVEVSVATDAGDEDALIDIVSRSANQVEVNLQDLPDARILLYVDAFYPGWRAYVDGQPVPILKANGVFKAVAVPKGTHTVRFVYRPWRVWAGLALSTAFLIIATVIFAWNFVKRPASPSCAPEGAA